jgi:hypothetical protein
MQQIGLACEFLVQDGIVMMANIEGNVAMQDVG